MIAPTKQNISIVDLFEEKLYLKICAPMVRYSKLQFRTLVRKYNCDLCFTPMILADSFCQSEKARYNEFSTNQNDSPLIVQFAANTIHDFVGAAELVSTYSDGVDLNCGCPQRWAKQMGLGCALLNNPQNINDIIKECHNRMRSNFSVSVKTRILKDLRKTVDICQKIEKAGATFLTIHARTPDQSTGVVNFEALRLISDSLRIPVVANGGVRTLGEANEMVSKTGCKGVMVANGLLQNPTLFSGEKKTHLQCIQDWLDICYNTKVRPDDYLEETTNMKPFNLTFQCFHHHLVFMLEKLLPKYKRRIFNNLQTFDDVLKFIENEFDLIPKEYDLNYYSTNCVIFNDYSNRDKLYRELKSDNNQSNTTVYDYDRSNGKFFSSVINSTQESDDDYNLGDVFY